MNLDVIFTGFFVQFSFPCMKYDRHKYKARNRAMILTEKVGVVWEWLLCALIN